jgi:hypothetical protein
MISNTSTLTTTAKVNKPAPATRFLKAQHGLQKSLAHQLIELPLDAREPFLHRVLIACSVGRQEETRNRGSEDTDEADPDDHQGDRD